MPRKPINYQNGLIYKLACNDPEIKEEYVGSTTSFKHRKRRHKSNCIDVNITSYVYKFIRDNGGWDNWSMVLIEYYPCNSQLELEQRERYYIELYESKLNSNIPTRTEDEKKEQKKEYYEKNKEQKKEYSKEYHKKYNEINKEKLKKQKNEYYKNNKEKLKEQRKEKTLCECGCVMRRDSITKHKKTNKHKKLMQK